MGSISNTVALLLFFSSCAHCTNTSTCPEFKCRDGYVRRSSGHQAQPNGCGPASDPQFTAALSKSFPGFVEMCNNHDICYGTCGKPKALCDNEFWEEMMDYCKSWQKNSTEFFRQCNSLANIYAAAVKALGCSAYTDAQKQACYCVRSNWLYHQTSCSIEPGQTHSSYDQLKKYIPVELLIFFTSLSLIMKDLNRILQNPADLTVVLKLVLLSKALGN